jgi:hypothetical protein
MTGIQNPVRKKKKETQQISVFDTLQVLRPSHLVVCGYRIYVTTLHACYTPHAPHPPVYPNNLMFVT